MLLGTFRLRKQGTLILIAEGTLLLVVFQARDSAHDKPNQGDGMLAPRYLHLKHLILTAHFRRPQPAAVALPLPLPS